jgi:TonB family protein
MNSFEARFRRNFVITAIVHAALVGLVFLGEGVLFASPREKTALVQLVTPADILGELPRGDGHGRGIYTPPPPQPPLGSPGGSGMQGSFVPPQPPAPQPPVARAAPPAPARPSPVPAPPAPVRPSPAPAPTASRPAAQQPSRPAQATSASRPASPSAQPSAARPSSGSGTGQVASGPTADEIRQRFAKALISSGGAGGTPYGDNRPAGGGSGAGPLGSPSGAPDGMAGGIGRGSPFWQYYLHVRERMYEAWERPGEAAALRKGLVATVTIVVAQDGRVLEVRLSGRSGSKVMDDSALAAARRVSRLNPLPSGFTSSSSAEIAVEFELEG